nr:peptide chain release factor 1 [Hymenolepis microstoma]
MRALYSLKSAFRNAPLMRLKRWYYNTDKKTIQNSSGRRVSNAIQGYLSKNNDLLLGEFERLSKIVSSDRSTEVKNHLWRLSSLRTLLDINQRLQALIALDADSTNLLQELDDGSDAVLQQIAASEAASRREQIKYLENQILELILPPDPNAFCSSVRLQLIAGAGGLEAAMFARDLFNMYEAYIIQKGWSIYPGEGGINALSDTDCPIHNTEVIVEAANPSDAIYTRLRWEAGVHRVQRVPVTSKLNKIHTSTVAVTVLPVVDEADIELFPEDLEWDVFRSSGAGGQHVNKTESAVRVKHKPTGHVATCQDDRSQHANREAALKALKAKIAKEASLKQVESELTIRRSQMGSLERSDRIRTYNYQQDRITDHRLSKSWNDLASCMRQNTPLIDEAAQALDEAYILNSLNSLNKPYFMN